MAERSDAKTVLSSSVRALALSCAPSIFVKKPTLAFGFASDIARATYPVAMSRAPAP